MPLVEKVLSGAVFVESRRDARKRTLGLQDAYQMAMPTSLEPRTREVSK
jgi:hypothetical protein